MSWAACAVCPESFASDRAFDRHRIAADRKGTRRCLTPKEMEARGWGKDSFGRWRDRGSQLELPLNPLQNMPRPAPNRPKRRRRAHVPVGALRPSDFRSEHEDAQGGAT